MVQRPVSAEPSSRQKVRTPVRGLLALPSVSNPLVMQSARCAYVERREIVNAIPYVLPTR